MFGTSLNGVSADLRCQCTPVVLGCVSNTCKREHYKGHGSTVVGGIRVWPQAGRRRYRDDHDTVELLLGYQPAVPFALPVDDLDRLECWHHLLGIVYR